MTTENHKFESIEKAADSIAYQRGGKILCGYEEGEKFMFYEEYRFNSTMVYDIDSFSDFIEIAHSREWIFGYELDGDSVWIEFHI